MFYLLNVETNTYTKHASKAEAQALRNPLIHVLVADGSAQAVCIDFAKPEGAPRHNTYNPAQVQAEPLTP
jgi:hypothetical protein